LFTAALTAGRTPIIFGDGLQSRDFTYVANAVQAVVKAAHAPAAVGKVYNIGTGGSICLLDLIKHLNQLLGTQIRPTFVTARPEDVRNSQADISMARRDLGYEPGISFVEGLRRTLESFQKKRGVPAA
jgi:UDP-glucose 4-epimerase